MILAMLLNEQLSMVKLNVVVYYAWDFPSKNDTTKAIHDVVCRVMFVVGWFNKIFILYN